MQPLADLGELEDHLQRTVDPGQGLQALTLASGAVRAYCGWDLARETTTFRVDGDGSPVLNLPTLCLIDVTAIRVDGQLLDLVFPVPSRFSLRGQLIRRDGWRKHSVVDVDVIHGYDPIPDLIKLVVLDMATSRLSNPEALTSATTGQVSRTWATGAASDGVYGMPALHAALLDRYRLF